MSPYLRVSDCLIRRGTWWITMWPTSSSWPSTPLCASPARSTSPCTVAWAASSGSSSPRSWPRPGASRRPRGPRSVSSSPWPRCSPGPPSPARARPGPWRPSAPTWPATSASAGERRPCRKIIKCTIDLWCQESPLHINQETNQRGFSTSSPQTNSYKASPPYPDIIPNYYNKGKLIKSKITFNPSDDVVKFHFM